MNDVILKVENLSKQYRLGTIGTGTISHDLNRWWAKIRGKEDPYVKLGEVNDRTTQGTSEYVWALKDINFEVSRGEVLGIIGKNGAGKSTLLKILSRVTAPTTGIIRSKGRIASLLEVGTGFHPEMTGRENIFLNGAILGMTKSEIGSKLEQIIDFSGCGRYIDTPVKRYSSGMTVRLAFAVAAHLDPDILIVDEVLAVGDIEFQKKAIGKMRNISKSKGRTVLFVSHNMGAIRQLCSRVIILCNGKVDCIGNVNESIDFYQKFNRKSNKYLNSNSNKDFYLHSAILSKDSNTFKSDEAIEFDFVIVCNYNFEKNKYLLVRFINSIDQIVFSSQIQLIKNVYNYKLRVKENTFVKGDYKINVIIYHPGVFQYDSVNDICYFSVLNNNEEFYALESFDIGNVYLEQEWIY